MDRTGLPEPRRVAIAPFDCFSRAGRLVEGDYWLFVGITALGLFIASAVPFALLAAPMYAGIYTAFRDKERGRPVAFEVLFSRFDTFVQGLIATLVFVGVLLAVTVPIYVVAAGTVIGGGAAMDEHNEGLGVVLLFVAGLAYLVAIVLVLLAQVAFTFTYALIADRGVDGITALKLSARAARTNFWGVLGLVLLVAVVALVALSLCFLPLLLVLPYVAGAPWVAYRKVFGEPPAEAAATAPDESWAGGV